MPIRESEKARYPSNWAQISLEARARAGWACEQCGAKNGWRGGRTETGAFLPADYLGCDRSLPEPGQHAWCSAGDRREYLRIIKIVLTVAHLDNRPENCAPENLKALCQRCHLWLDRHLHARNAWEKRHRERGNRDLFDVDGEH